MIVIRCNVLMKEEGLEQLHEDFVTMLSSGVILLPAFCELLNEVPPDDEVVVVGKKER